VKSIAVNARFYAHRPTGMQRYAIELSSRFDNQAETVRPSTPLTGMAGHLWEQVYLPAAARGRVLWSPNNTGPVATYRQVCTFHDLIPLDNPEWFSPRFSGWYRWLMPRLARNVAHIIAVSEFTRRRIVESFGVRPSKVTVIPNGIDQRFSPRPMNEIAAERKALGVPDGEYFLFLGSLEPRKNLSRLLLAWEQAQSQLPKDTWLVVAGAKGRSQVFSEVPIGKLPPRVHLTGYVREEGLPAIYSGALALVYPSLYEGFGLPPLEAMACGTPVITSNTTSVPEVTGAAAVLVDPLSSDEIAKAIGRVGSDAGLRQDLSRRGLARAANYSWDAAASATLKVLESYM
jgi:glycosyltransferase involved in cell wall biosynthesis